MSLIFHTASGSQYGWRVHLALEHKGVPHELRMLSFSAGDTRTPEFLALNPRHKVPVIVDDGFALYESAAIVEYLDERFPQHRALLPGDAAHRAVCRRLMVEIDTYLAAHHQRIARQLFFKPDPATWDTAALSEATAGYAEELRYLDHQLKGDFLVGAPSAADLTLYPFLATIARFERRKPDLGLGAAISPGLRAWMARIEAFPYFDRTYPPHWRDR
jgi:glutathione S-transferase